MLKQLFGLVVVSALAGASPALGQGIELEPYLGYYIPVQDILDETVNVPGVGDVEFKGSQKQSLALGGRLTLWLAGPLGVEGNFLYAFGEAETTEGGVTTEDDAYVWAADGRLIFKLLPGPIGLHIDGGVAAIGRGGDAYQDVTEGKTDFGGVLGVGLRIKLPGLFAIRGDVDAFAYSSKVTADVDGEVIEFDSQFQVDAVASVGLVIGLGL